MKSPAFTVTPLALGAFDVRLPLGTVPLERVVPPCSRDQLTPPPQAPSPSTTWAPMLIMPETGLFQPTTIGPPVSCGYPAMVPAGQITVCVLPVGSVSDWSAPVLFLPMKGARFGLALVCHT